MSTSTLRDSAIVLPEPLEPIALAFALKEKGPVEDEFLVKFDPADPNHPKVCRARYSHAFH